jgi:ADP-ribose pyrophosphatase YjhB (NUDIX family)
MPKVAQNLPKIVVAGLLKKNGKYLLVKEVLSNGEETWIVPGGKVEFGEKLEDAIKRELMEELTIIVDETKFIAFKEAVFPDYNYHTVIFFYVIKTKTTNFTLENGILDAQFFSADELKNLRLVDSAEWLFKKIGVL